MGPAVWVAAVASAVSAVFHLIVVVPRLPSPATVPGEEPPDYPSLATPAAAVAVAMISLSAAVAILPRVPDTHLICWFGLLGAGTALGWVDLRTTWLPRVLNHVCLAQVLAGVAVLAFFDAMTAMAAMAGGLAAFGLFHLVWRLGSGFGYGDVRLAGIVGVIAGTAGLQFWFSSILLATLVGALWAVVHAVRTRRTGKSPFPYGPALWAGPVIAAALGLG